MFTDEHVIIRKKFNTDIKADQIIENLSTNYIPDNFFSFIESLKYFFLATSNKDGYVNTNFKGTQSKHLIKILNKKEIIFPNYSGNGIYHGMGDIKSNPNIGMLCIDFNKNLRVKISGKAQIIDDIKVIEKYFDIFETYDIEMLVKVEIEYFIPNCSRNISVVKNSILEYEKEKF